MPERLECPAGLASRGERLWRDVTGKWTLRPDELVVLEDACREADLITRLEAEVADSDLMSIGSMGQPVVNPLVAELRQHRSTFQRLVRSLKLPDDPGEAQASRSSSAREAAVARWSGGAAG